MGLIYGRNGGGGMYGGTERGAGGGGGGGARINARGAPRCPGSGCMGPSRPLKARGEFQSYPPRS